MKAVIIYHNNEPLAIYSVKELHSSDFLTIQKNCDANLKNLLLKMADEKKELMDRVAKLEEEVKILKGEE